jgi:mono/diheme cytochrome c family protein
MTIDALLGQTLEPHRSMSRTIWFRTLIAVLIALAALVLIRLHTAAGARGRDSISNGRRLAGAWCRDCHSLETASPGVPSAPDFIGIANRTSTTELSLKVFLRTNHQNMPSDPRTRSNDDLVRFILSLRRD